MILFLAFFALLITAGFIDIRSMKKTNTKKEIVPYLALMLIAGAVGFLYLLNPHGKSIAFYIMSIFNIKG